MRIEGKLALITGAGSGIGRALALEAGRRGARLILTGRRRAALEETCALARPGSVLAIIPGDITQPSDRRRLRERIFEGWGRIDILVNNAGTISAGPVAAMSDGDIESMVATNLTAPIALTRELLPLLGAGSEARIVNLGSMFGEIAYPFFAAYSATKFGLRGFSMALRRELRASGIGVTFAAPRATRTEATEALVPLLTRLDIKPDNALDVASGIWDAVARGAGTAYPGGRERLYVLTQRLLPWIVDRAIAARLRNGGLVRRLAAAMRWRVGEFEARPDRPDETVMTVGGLGG